MHWYFNELFVLHAIAHMCIVQDIGTLRILFYCIRERDILHQACEH